MAAGDTQPRSRTRRTSLFATTAPGLGRMLRRQLGGIGGIDVTGTGFDGTSDIVFFSADRFGRADALRSRLAEDVVAEIGRASRAGGARALAVASTAWRPDSVQRALSVWAEEVRPLAGSMTFRVVPRVLSDVRFSGTDLRRALAERIALDKPRWRFADTAQLEFRITEYHDGQFVAGLRLRDGAGQRHAGREPGRPGALPPTVAAAMVELARLTAAAGKADGTLLDPCCGFGTILAEALAAGWAAEGTDIEPESVEAAALAAPGATVQLGDARELLLPDDYVAACVSNLSAGQRPGQQFSEPGGWQEWAGTVLAEMSRVTRSGGAVVVLAPELPRPWLPSTLRLRRQVPLRQLGPGAAIWAFRRA